MPVPFGQAPFVQGAFGQTVTPPGPVDAGGSLVGGPDVLGGHAAAIASIPRTPGYGWLVELDTGLPVREWLAASAFAFDDTGTMWDDTGVTFGGGTGTYRAALDKAVRCIDAVHEDGVALAAVASVSLVETTAGSWYFDAAGAVLWIHTTDDGAPGGKVLIATVVELYKFGPGQSVFLRNGVPQVYHARLRSVPSVTLELPANEIGTSAIAEFGQLELDNHDGHFSGDSREARRGLLAERLFAGRAMRSYRGAMDLVDRDAFTPWMAAVMERPSCVPETCTVPLVSRARLLAEPLCPDTFDAADYPDMDPDIAGVTIPDCYGPVRGAEAFRIASGEWLVGGRGMTAITACTQENGAAVTILTTDLPTGTFTVSVALNGERRLYVDGTGRVPTGRPGALLSQIAQDGGVAPAERDAVALAELDEDLPAAVGLQVLGGTVREALDRVATSTGIDWFITRLSQLSARLRRRDQGNLVSNAGFEVDTIGWLERNGATITRTTAHHARGVACLEITKSAGDPLGYARVLPRRPVVAGRQYTFTALVGLAPGSPATDACRLALVDGVGTVDLSEPFSLVPGVWQRVRCVSQGVTSAGATWSRADLTFDRTDITFAMTEVECRIYPQHGGMAAVVLLVDEVEWVETRSIADHQADVTALTTESLVASRFRVRYGFDGRTGAGQYALAEDAALKHRYPAAESQQLDGDLVASADAELVGAAALDFYGPTRARLALTVKAPLTVPIGLETVIDLAHRRAPGLVEHSGLWRVVALHEGQAGDNALPTIELELVAHYDPAADRLPIAA